MSYNAVIDLYNWNENEKSKSEIFKLIEENLILCLQEYYFTNDENLPFETRNLILDSLGFHITTKVFQKKVKKISFLELLFQVNTLL